MPDKKDRRRGVLVEKNPQNPPQQQLIHRIDPRFARSTGGFCTGDSLVLFLE
jgi:hypothetical protein